ncbi:helix-turn-helix domain-containing protein (plasmid) [Streptomyces sp. L7]
MRLVPVNDDQKRPTMLTPKAPAAQLSVDVEHLRRLRDQGIGPAYIRITPRTVRYLSSEVAEWLDDEVMESA